MLADNGRERITTNLGQHGRRTKIQLLGPMGKTKTLKMHKRGSHFVKKLRFLMFSDISRFFVLGAISGNINLPGGYRGQIPGFWKPRFRQKVEFENGLVDFF